LGNQLQVFGVQICIVLHCAHVPLLLLQPGRFGFKQSIPHRDKVTEMKIPDFVSTKNYILFKISASGLFLKYS